MAWIEAVALVGQRLQVGEAVAELLVLGADAPVGRRLAARRQIFGELVAALDEPAARLWDRHGGLASAPCFAPALESGPAARQAAGVEIRRPRAPIIGASRKGMPMCRNIKPLFNFEPPATDDEIRAAALQFVRKVSGFNKPSQANEAAFERGVDEVAKAARPAPRLAGDQRRAARPGDRGGQGPRALARPRFAGASAPSPAPRSRGCRPRGGRRGRSASAPAAPAPGRRRPAAWIGARAVTVRPSVRLEASPIQRSGCPGSSTATWPGRGLGGEGDLRGHREAAAVGLERAGHPRHPRLGRALGARGERRLDPRPPLLGRVGGDPRCDPRLGRHADVGADPEVEREAEVERRRRIGGHQPHRQHHAAGIADRRSARSSRRARPRPFGRRRGEVPRSGPVEGRRDAGAPRRAPVGVPAGREADLDRRRAGCRPAAASPSSSDTPRTASCAAPTVCGRRPEGGRGGRARGRQGEGAWTGSAGRAGSRTIAANPPCAYSHIAARRRGGPDRRRLACNRPATGPCSRDDPARRQLPARPVADRHARHGRPRASTAR